MNESRPHPTRIEELLEQDVVVSSFDFGEFHMKLDESIKRLEVRARLIHRAALVSLAIFIICVVTVPLVISLKHIWVLRVWSGCGLVALFTAFVFAAIDHYKYRPVLKRKERDSILAAIDQLQFEVTELKEKLK